MAMHREKNKRDDKIMSYMKCPLCKGKANIPVEECISTDLGRASLSKSMSEAFKAINQMMEEKPELRKDAQYTVNFADSAECPLCLKLGKIDTDERRTKDIFQIGNYKVEEE